ncbi:hypothetical protein ACFLSG_05055 [Candidatus Bipolaricaulota bacterium]
MKTLREALAPLVDAVQLCLDKQLIMPAVILIYSGIDIVGGLAREGSHRDTRADFTGWVDLYMLPDPNMGVTSIDLYGARCGLLHNLSPSSDLSESGEAKEVMYAWGSKSANEAQTVIDCYSPGWIALHTDTLFGAFRRGLDQFFAEEEDDAARQTLLASRAQLVFEAVSESLMQRILDLDTSLE